MKIAWASCEDLGAPGVGWARIAEQSPDIFISQGDTPYVGDGAASWGSTTASAVLSTSQAQMLVKYQQFWAKPPATALLALRSSGMLAYYQADDHEWGGDDWDHTITQANTQTSIGAVTQADVNTHWARGKAARLQFLAASWDNPTPNAAGNTELPSQASVGASPATTDYPIEYFVLDIGDVRLIFLDCISYRSPVAATDNSSKRMLGATQEAWLIARVAEAAAKQHVFISSTKLFFATNAPTNSDTFGVYTTERNRIGAALQATGMPVIWLSGDRHLPHVVDTRVSRGGIMDLLDVCACPIGLTPSNLGRTFPVSGPRLEWVGNVMVLGLITVDSAGCTIELRNAQSGSVVWSARVAPRSNVPVYAAAPTVLRIA